MPPLEPFMQSWVEFAALGWSVLVALVLQLGSFLLLKQTGKRFEAVTAGHEPFDFQNKLTVAQIDEQLPYYTAKSKRLYTLFFVIDFFFPFIASIFLSLL